MAFLWLHCAHNEDRVIYLDSLKDAYNAGLVFIRNKSSYCRIVPFEQIENSNFFPIAEYGGFQLIIGQGHLGHHTLLYYNGHTNISIVRV